MPQSDYVQANIVHDAYLAALNVHLAAIVTNNSGAAPSDTFAAMLWADDTAGPPWEFNVRSHDNASWATVWDSDGNIIASDGTFTGDVTIPTGDLEVTAGMFGVGGTPTVDGHFQGAANLQVRIDHTGAGHTGITRDMSGLELLAETMNPTSKYTAAIKFMSTDAQFTTDNPKLLGVIVGRATEGYAADTDGGIAIDLFTSPDNVGASSAPALAMTWDQNTDVIIPTGNLGVGVTPLTDVHVDMNATATLTTLAGSVFLQAFNNAGAGNLGSGVIFGSAVGSILPSDGASIVGYQPTGSPATAGLGFYTHGAGVGFPRELAMQLDEAQNMGVGGVAPTLKLSVMEKAGITPIGGFAIKVTNKTGSPTVKGQLVIASTVTADAFATAPASSDEVIGIVYEAGVADGSEAWIVGSGKADVLIDAGGCVIGDRLVSSATAGSADVNNLPIAAVHFQEVGHSFETRVGAGLARLTVHFN